MLQEPTELYMKAVDDAFSSKIGNLFDSLVDGLVHKDSEAAKEYARGLELVWEAREIAINPPKVLPE
jgi:hypothetical protein